MSIRKKGKIASLVAIIGSLACSGFQPQECPSLQNSVTDVDFSQLSQEFIQENFSEDSPFYRRPLTNEYAKGLLIEGIDESHYVVLTYEGPDTVEQRAILYIDTGIFYPTDNFNPIGDFEPIANAVLYEDGNDIFVWTGSFDKLSLAIDIVKSTPGTHTYTLRVQDTSGNLIESNDRITLTFICETN